MKWGASLRGGALGGVLAGVLLTATGRLLELGLSPWDSSLVVDGYFDRALAWVRTAAVLATVGAVVGAPAGIICGIVFEYVTQRAGWLVGGAVGLLLGLIAAAGIGLVPWAFAELPYAYRPAIAPMGPTDPSWLFGALIGSGVIVGMFTGIWYGPMSSRSAASATFDVREVYRSNRRT